MLVHQMKKLMMQPCKITSLCVTCIYGLLQEFPSCFTIFLNTFSIYKIICQPIERLGVVLFRTLNGIFVFNLVFFIKGNKRRRYARCHTLYFFLCGADGS